MKILWKNCKGRMSGRKKKKKILDKNRREGSKTGRGMVSGTRLPAFQPGSKNPQLSDWSK